MVEEALKKLAAELKELAEDTDYEVSHGRADEALLEALDTFGRAFHFEVEVGILKKRYLALTRWHA